MSTIHGIQIPSEDEIREIESTGLCVINRQFTLPWFHSKQAPPQVGHIYSEIGQREIFPVVDNHIRLQKNSSVSPKTANDKQFDDDGIATARQRR